MKVNKLNFLILLALILSACGGSKPAAPSAPEKPAAVTDAPSATKPPTITEPPTATPIPPTATPEFQQYFTEEFDKDSKYWTYFVMDGWNSVIVPNEKYALGVKDGSLSFDLPKTLWIYSTYDPFEYADVRVEAQAENIGTNNNNVSLFCRYTKDGWYEFNVANNGLYWIFRATVKGGGAVSYTLLQQGGSNKIVQGNTPGKNTNIYAITCKGDTLSLFINDKPTKKFKDSKLKSGKVGVSVSAFGTAVNVNFNWVKISQP